MESSNQHHLLQPFLPPNAISSPAAHATSTNVHKEFENIKVFILSSSDIILRFALIILIGTISIWANHEASKGFAITIINDAGNSLAGKRFTHFYISDDKATRIILNTSKFVENILYPDYHKYDHQIDSANSKKQVNHVILRLASHNMTTKFAVESRSNHKYILHLSPSIMEEKNFNYAIVSAIQHGMTGIWLRNGQQTVPEPLLMPWLNTSLAGFHLEFINSDKKSPESDLLTELLDHCGKKNLGLIRQLNQAMKDDWHISTVEYSNACGGPQSLDQL